MKLRELTEIQQRDPSGRFIPGVSKYGMEGKPEWFDKAVQLKKNNPQISLKQIAKQLGIGWGIVSYWLTGDLRRKNPGTYIKRPDDSFPFKPEDFPTQTGYRPYGIGGKPPWYDQAVKMAKAGVSFRDIGKELNLGHGPITNWLVKGKKWKSGELVNPDAPLEPGRIGRQINPQVIADVENLLKDPKLSDDDIVDLLINTYGGKTAGQVRGMLPTMRQKLNPGTKVIDKTGTGVEKDPDITGLI